MQVNNERTNTHKGAMTLIDHQEIKARDITVLGQHASSAALDTESLGWDYLTAGMKTRVLTSNDIILSGNTHVTKKEIAHPTERLCAISSARYSIRGDSTITDLEPERSLNAGIVELARLYPTVNIRSNQIAKSEEIKRGNPKAECKGNVGTAMLPWYGQTKNLNNSNYVGG